MNDFRCLASYPLLKERAGHRVYTVFGQGNPGCGIPHTKIEEKETGAAECTLPAAAGKCAHGKTDEHVCPVLI
jgi:hypothetical protein